MSQCIARVLTCGANDLLMVRPGTRPEDTLVAAMDYLQCAAATAYEVADNQHAELRPLARAVMHQVNTALLLVEASLGALNRQASPDDEH